VFVSLDWPSSEVPCFDPELGGFIGTLPDRPRNYTVWSAVEPLLTSEKGLVHLSRCNSRWFCHRLSMTEDVDILIVFTLFSIAEAGIYIICVSTVMVRNCTHYGCPQHLNQVSNKLYPPQVFRRVCQNTHPKLSIHQLLESVSPPTPRLSIHSHTYICKA
jgi:hypothetical protein